MHNHLQVLPSFASRAALAAALAGVAAAQFPVPPAAQAPTAGPLSAVPSIGGGPVTPVDVVSGDFNGDGVPDLATVDAAQLTAYFYPGTAAPTGTTAGAFGLATTISLAVPGLALTPLAIAAGDVSGDGISDICILITGGLGAGSLVAVLLGGPAGPTPSALLSGASVVAPGLPATAAAPQALRLRDVDADGVLEVVYAGAVFGGSTTLFVFDPNAAPVPAPVPIFVVAPGPVSSFELVDFDADTLPDVVALLPGGAGVVTAKNLTLAGAPWLGNPPAQMPGLVAPTRIAAGNFLGTGAEIVVSDATAVGHAILFGTFVSPTGLVTPVPGITGADLEAADIEGDGLADVIVGIAGGIDVLRTAGVLMARANLVTAGAAASITVFDASFDRDGDGIGDFVYGQSGGAATVVGDFANLTPVAAWTGSSPNPAPIGVGMLTAPALQFGGQWQLNYSVPTAPNWPVTLVVGTPLASPVTLPIPFVPGSLTAINGSLPTMLTALVTDGAGNIAYPAAPLTLPTIPAIAGLQAALQIVIYNPLNGLYQASDTQIVTWGF